MNKTSKSLQINGKTLTLETGQLAPQATAAVLGRLGDTMVLATVVVGKESNLGYFPLSVDFVERLYAGGRIKGSKWVKREGRPTDDAILTGRLIDRSIRPLFPKAFKRDVQVVVTVMSVDGENEPDILGLICTSAALAISKIPWNGPVASSRVGIIQDKEGKKEFVINPVSNDLLDLDMVVSSTKERALMLEAGAKQVTEEDALTAIVKAKEWNVQIIDMINELVKEVGQEKLEVAVNEKMEEVKVLVEKSYKDKIKAVIEGGVDKEVGGQLDAISDIIYEQEKETTDDKSLIKEAVDYVFKKTIRENILADGKRPDGRPVDQVRPISIEIGVLPRTHGSAIFQRGETQVLTVATLGAPSMEQLIESPQGEEAKRYIHHYSMPPYTVGETGRIGTPSRREIGHGALAERALEPVMPPESKFPYVVRMVSEVMSSNGSTSMASTCGSTLALMDAGVPIIEPVAGLAIGLMTKIGAKGEIEKHVVLTDIIGLEDFSGDMDFKVTGTKNGITAIQLDVKIAGITDEIIAETFERAKAGRLFILDKMKAALEAPREKVSAFAPKIKVIKIDKEQIGEVIGSGGRVIRNIIANTGAEVEVDEDGNVTVTSVNEEDVNKAVEWITLLTRELNPGEIFEGTVKRILPFGAVVEIVPGKEGLVHVSQMSTEYVKDPSDVVSLGQTVKVRVKEIDDQGRTNLSMVFGEKKEAPREERRDDRRESRPYGRNEGRPDHLRMAQKGRMQHRRSR